MGGALHLFQKTFSWVIYVYLCSDTTSDTVWCKDLLR